MYFKATIDQNIYFKRKTLEYKYIYYNLEIKRTNLFSVKLININYKPLENWYLPSRYIIYSL